MKPILFISILFFLTINCLPQPVAFEFDYAQFGYDSTSNYVEFYYSFEQASLTLFDTDSGDYVQGILIIAIEDSTTCEVLVDKSWSISNYITDTMNIERSLIGLVGFVLRKGSYRCNISGSDAVKTGSEKTIAEFIRIKPFLND